MNFHFFGRLQISFVPIAELIKIKSLALH